jgi:hypothetical protein
MFNLATICDLEIYIYSLVSQKDLKITRDPEKKNSWTRQFSPTLCQVSKNRKCEVHDAGLQCVICVCDCDLLVNHDREKELGLGVFSRNFPRALERVSPQMFDTYES